MNTVVELSRNNCGYAGIGATDYDENDMGIRAYVLSSGSEWIHDEVMARRFEDFRRLIGDNAEFRVDRSFSAFTAEQWKKEYQSREG